MEMLAKREIKDCKVQRVWQEDLENRELKEKKGFLILIWLKLEDRVQLGLKEMKVSQEEKDCLESQDKQVQGVLWVLLVPLDLLDL